ncbi:TraB domain-containing protein [Papilio machaon]|uniref:TraB domain-containing protein n=1 Tax=Papilio machaon TaxID=76193 RepID=A0A194R1L6_PAPMA|nr:TraB domain-containing protein [Papilio machaon]
MDTIKSDKSSLGTNLEKEQLLMNQKPPGVKCDIVNECQMFLKAEDGGGDGARLKITDSISPKIDGENDIVKPTTSKKQEETSEKAIEESKNESDSEVNEEMPSTVTVLDTPDGGKVYLVGTAHFSIKSQEDVSRVIQEVSPHIVMVELCEQRTNILLLDEEIILREAKNINIKKIRATMAQNGVFNGLMYILLLNMSAHITRELGMAPGGEFRRAMAEVIQEVSPHIVMVELCEQRTNILLLDEEIILREAKNINIKKIRATMAQNGVFNGLMYILLLNMSAHITRELGMAPGGEFRRAMAEAKKIPNCVLQLGDRAIDITLHRAIASLTWGQTIRFIWHLLTSNQSISVEEVEKCKMKKMLDDMLEEMAEEFPALKRVFVVERDMYLCHSLQIAAMQPRNEPCRIVGVVGIGHVAGIVEHWGKITAQDITPLLVVPPPSLSTRILRVSVRAACAGAIIYAAYKFFPRRLLP